MTRRFSITCPPQASGLERKVGLSRVLGAVFPNEASPVRIGRFELAEEVGRGAMGVVYRARDPDLERDVALKVLSRDARDFDIDAMVAEARSLAKVNHPHVVSVHEVAEEDGEVYIAMEYVEGDNLNRWLASHPDANASEVVALFVQAARGLAAAHAAGVIHRDFKPHNVLVGKDGRVRVIDFGLALTGVPNSGEVAGTWRFMAPEQRAGGEVDARSDQYAFCVALWSALAPGGPPGEGGSGIPTRVRRALLRGFAEAPDERWPSMDHLANELSSRPRRSGWLALGGLLAITAIGVAAAMPGSPTQGPSNAAMVALCEDPSPRIEAAWGPPQRSDLAKAFGKKGPKLERSGFVHLSESLDRYADRWRTNHDRACLDLQADTVEVVTRADDALACLDAAASDLAWFVEDVAAMPSEELDLAARGLLALRTPEQCARGGFSHRNISAHQDIVRDLYRADVAASMHQFERAQRLNASALRRATGRGLELLTAEAELGLAKNDLMRREFDDGQAHADEALAAAERAGDVELMARAWLRKSDLSRERRDLDQAEFAISRAKNLRVRLPPNSEVEAEIAFDEADLRFDQGRHEEAVALFDRAHAAFLAAGRPHRTAQVNCDASNAWLELGDTKRASESLTKCVDGVSASLGPHHPSLATPMAMATSLYLVLGQNERAMSYGERAVALWREGTGVSDAQRAQVFALVAGVAAELERWDTADALLAEAHELVMAAGKPEPVALILVNTQRGVTLTERGRCPEAIPLYDEVIDAFESRDDAPRDQMVGTWMNRAECHAKLGDPPLALADLERAWSISPHDAVNPHQLRMLRHDGQIRLLAGDARGAEKSLSSMLEADGSDDVSAADRAHARFLLAKSMAAQGRRVDALAQVELARALYIEGGHEHPQRAAEFETWARSYTSNESEIK